jgi:AraC family transcriptional regulator, carnitine catabolism transcriptional activator
MPEASHRWGTRDERLIRAITLIESRLTTPPGDAELAGVCGVSIRQMQRLFANAFSTTPQAFALAWRLDQSLMRSD